MRVMTVLALSLLAANAVAAVYKWTQPDGTVIYSDQPPSQGAGPADLPPVQEITIVPPPRSSSDSEDGAPARETERAIQYARIEVTSPENNAVIRDNAGNVNVALRLEPALREGDKVAVILDGREVGQGASTSLTLSNVDRGTHSLQAAVKTADGQTLIQSPTISFTLQRTSILQPKR